MSVREIPEAETVVADDIFGRACTERARRHAVLVRAMNGWDLDRMKAARENCVALPGLIIGDLLRNLVGWFGG